MEITVQVSKDMARRLRGERPTTPETEEILEIIADSGSRLASLDLEARQPVLGEYFVVSVPDVTAAERVVARLQKCPAVEAAYLKPAGEPPMELP